MTKNTNETMTGAPPLITEVSKPWWNALANETIEMQQCDQCQRWVFYPRPFCHHCGHRSLSWRPLAPEATLYTWSIAEVPVAPAFAHLERPIMAVAEFPNGIRVPTTLVNIAHEDIQIGMPLSAVFDHDSYEGATLLRFQPQSESKRQEIKHHKLNTIN